MASRTLSHRRFRSGLLIWQWMMPEGEEDRKSTRLNSSHGYISYAVFCLKKKKKTGDNIQIDNGMYALHRCFKYDWSRNLRSRLFQYLVDQLALIARFYVSLIVSIRYSSV